MKRALLIFTIALGFTLGSARLPAATEFEMEGKFPLATASATSAAWLWLVDWGQPAGFRDRRMNFVELSTALTPDLTSGMSLTLTNLSNLTVTNNVAFLADLDVTGELEVTATATLLGNVAVGGFLYSTNDAAFLADVAVSGDVDITGDLDVTGFTDIKGESIFRDLATFTDTLSAAAVSADSLLVGGHSAATLNVLASTNTADTAAIDLFTIPIAANRLIHIDVHAMAAGPTNRGAWHIEGTWQRGPSGAADNVGHERVLDHTNLVGLQFNVQLEGNDLVGRATGVAAEDVLWFTRGWYRLAALGDPLATLPPDLNSVTVDATGTNWVFAFTRPVTAGLDGWNDWTVSMTAAGAITLAYASGDGTDTITYGATPAISADDTIATGLDYTPPGDGIQNVYVAGYDLATVTGATIVNDSDLNPKLVSAVIDATGDNWVLTFDEAVEAGLDGSAGWAVTMDTSGIMTLTYASGDGTTALTYTGGVTVAAGEAAVGGINYTQPGAGLVSVATGYRVRDITAAAVTNNSAAP